MRSRLALALATPIAAVALAACGGSSASSGTTVPAGLTVKALDGIRFDQSTYTATAGDVVVAYVDNSSLAHNLHFVDANGTSLPEVLEVTQNGQRVTKTVKLAPGTYTLLCKVPGHDNMKAKLTVS